MDRKAFFAHLRRRDVSIFGTSLSQRQVEGIEPYLDEGKHLSLSHMAHVLAEVYHETGGGMYPVKETVYSYSKNKNPSDATVIARLDRAWAKGQLPWVKTPYWRDGMFGRGGIQITHERNYRKLSPHVGVDLVAHPDQTLDPVIAARIAIKGLELGIFTGEKLGDHDEADGSFDHDDARSMVNGDERRPVGDGLDMGDRIEEYALDFEAALKAGGWKEPRRFVRPDAPSQPATAPSRGKGGLWGGIAALVASGGAAVAAKGCEWFGWFCG
ncbi:hypothetical protein PVV74_11850 [Roseovarius sp. SK2]|uniref:glycoside hydrolase family 19 protein n=1 Tax=Roseovarius TaxID=74030 RepID=UPI00237BB69B|nr:glycoside hydrolase family 19 protein [Roseovarius sp. SK2]MDD9726151.1 hypothetical protein [Roseovarius sp. SK2]